jgi:hypothetical protein
MAENFRGWHKFSGKRAVNPSECGDLEGFLPEFTLSFAERGRNDSVFPLRLFAFFAVKYLLAWLRLCRPVFFLENTGKDGRRSV